jgi:hypothetical protein
MSKYYQLDLTFDAILQKTLSIWPNPVHPGRIYKSPNLVGSYTLADLWNMYVGFSRDCVGDYYFLFISDMHTSIHKEYHRLAYTKGVIEKIDLNFQNIKIEFYERTLNNFDIPFENEKYDFPPHVLDQVKAYLANPQNHP